MSWPLTEHTPLAPHVSSGPQSASLVQPSPVPAEQSLDVIAILDGLYRSAEAGKEIVLQY